MPSSAISELARQSLERAVSIADDPRTRARARAALVEVALEHRGPCARCMRREGFGGGAGRSGGCAKRGDAAPRPHPRRGSARPPRRGTACRPGGPLQRARARSPGGRRAGAGRDCGARRSLRRTLAMRSSARGVLSRKRLTGCSIEHSSRSSGSFRFRSRASSVRARVGDADLFAIEDVCRGQVLLIDACRRLAIGGRVTIPLARRPVLFALLLELGRSWPRPVPRDDLATRVFDARRVNPSHRARLRVEVGRLRKIIDGLGRAAAGDCGGLRSLVEARRGLLLLPPSDDDAARVGFLLGDGASWSAKGLAEHAGISTRTAQRALGALVQTGGAVRTGKGRDVRYARPGTPLASRMLLLGLVPKA